VRTADQGSADQDLIESWPYERNRDLRQSAGNRVRRPVRLPENALAATDGGLRSAKNVPIVWVDHATIKGRVHGMREGVS
jgi:hypothetical protein